MAARYMLHNWGIEMIDEGMDLEEKQAVDVAISEGSEAFWKAVAEAFPAITTGDFPPDETVRFEKAMRRAVNCWLAFNRE
jgi:hypothetical protein